MEENKKINWAEIVFDEGMAKRLVDSYNSRIREMEPVYHIVIWISNTVEESEAIV